MTKRKVAFDGLIHSTAGYHDDKNPLTAAIAWLLSAANEEATKYEGDPFTLVYFPLFSDFSENSTAVGAMWALIHWALYFQNQLPNNARGLIVVLENSCNSTYTYRIDGSHVKPLGDGDLHDPDFESFVRTASFEDVFSIEDGTASGLEIDHNGCPFSIRVYPSKDFIDNYKTNTPVTVTLSVLSVFIFAVLMFFIYDRLVERRQHLLLQKAAQTHKIVASLFPKNIRNQLLMEGKENQKCGPQETASHRLESYLNEGNDNHVLHQAPMADLYPNATVLFADISGFTAWSSSREPSQVFILLQSVYQAFDNIAQKRKVFKVETIGDSVSSLVHVILFNDATTLTSSSTHCTLDYK